MAYLPDIRTFGFSGPGDDARYGQARFAGVDKVRRVHLPSQGVDVLQNGHLNLKRQQQFRNMSYLSCIIHTNHSKKSSLSHLTLP